MAKKKSLNSYTLRVFLQVKRKNIKLINGLQRYLKLQCFCLNTKNESVHIKHYHGLYKLFEHNFLAVWQYMRKILNNLQWKDVIILKIMGFTQNVMYNVILFLVNRPPLPCIHTNVCINIKDKILYHVTRKVL